ncbi:putative catalytic protein [Seiridium unicorne]|uniref:Catalytic protein n=1 Tax=Seiridium unicorne TaxID=138068 RepID=A0ABR2UJ89_9PEZI
MASPATRPTIVLVQGSFQLPDVYYRLRDALRGYGYSVNQPPLPSLNGQDKPDFASKSLTDDALSVRSEIKRLVEAGETVVLVMHSYGGLVGSEAVTEDLSFAQRRPNGLHGGFVHLFYFAAFILSKGQSVLGVFGGSANNDVKPDGRFTLSESANLLYHDLPEQEAQYWQSKIIDQSYAVQQTEITNEAYRFVSSTYVVCEADRGPPPQYQKMFGTIAGSETQSINSGHSPMLSHPLELAKMIDQATKAAVKGID